MRLKNVPGAREAVDASPLVLKNAEDLKGRWSSQVFGNSHPVHLEIGMGKGRFLTALALRNPDVNYVGIEKYTSVLYRAVQRREETEISNLFYLNEDAEKLESFFGPGEVGRIYLNFSDPWPKDRHHKRRLTSREFLQRYVRVLAPGGAVEFKTDNRNLFAFSLEEAEASGWTVADITWDLRKSPMYEGNIMTEYEEKFSLLGEKIMKMILLPPAGAEVL